MSSPWMPLWIGDYLKDTSHLCAAEHGAYLLLIMHYWQTGSLPTEDRHLAMIARMEPKEWKKYKATIMAFFDDGWRHKRIDKELIESEIKSSQAKRAANKRWENEKKTDAPALRSVVRK